MSGGECQAVRPLILIVMIALFGVGIARLQEWLTTLGSPLDVTSFFAGVLATVIFGLLWFRLNNWHGSMGGMSRPQSVNLETKQTPARVTLSSILAFFKLVVSLLLLTALFVALLDVDLAELFHRLTEALPR